MDDKLLIVLGLLLVIFLVILIVFGGIALYVLIKKNPELFKKVKQSSTSKENHHAEVIKKMEEADVLPEVLEENCHTHKDKRAQALCAICMDAFCEKCIIEDDKLHFCTQHYKIYKQNSWNQLEQVRTTPEQAHLSEYLYKFKNTFWKNNNIPMLVVTHYQINIDQDQIESEISLLAPSQNMIELKSQLEEVKKLKDN